MLFKSDVVLAPRTIAVRGVVDPARIIINSISMLTMTQSHAGLGDWIYQTYDDMSPQLRHDNEVALQLLDLIELSDGPMEFPTLIAHIEAQDFEAALAKLVAHIAERAGVSPDAVLASRESYSDIVLGLLAKKGDDCDAAVIDSAYEYMLDAEKAKRFLAGHLQTMWTKYFEAEWKHVRPVLLDTIAAFDQLDLSDLTPLEAIQAVTGRDMTNFWKEDDVEELIFVPSTHSGPYMSQWDKDEKNRVHIIYSARMPEGVESVSTELSLRELLVQFQALGDDTRLHILALLTQHRELCSQDFQQMLNLSQSATSRHVRQLVASGFLNERRRDLNKYFSLNQRRVHETATAMKMLLARK